jgi:hypothetical protein
MRSANKVIAEQDLGVNYFTSSIRVKNNFSEYDTEIVAYFVDQISAFEFENDLIKEHWGNPLLLNRHYQKSMSKFSMAGSKREDLAEYNRKAKTNPKEERTYKCAICENVFTRLEFCHYPKKENPVCGQKCNGVRNGKMSAGKPNLKISQSRTGKSSWNKGKKGTGFGDPNLNPMKNPDIVKKMLAARKLNREKKRGIGL